MFDLWESAFRSAFTEFSNNNLSFALIQCRHFISRYIQAYPDSPIAQWEQYSHAIEDTVIGKNVPPHGENCKCPIPTEINLVRWFCLKCFILFRMVVLRVITHERENIDTVRWSQINAAKAIHEYGFCNEDEFAYLKTECRLKYAILTIDYLFDDPWAGWSMLKKLNKNRRYHESDQNNTIASYLTKAEAACMIYYITKRGKHCKSSREKQSKVKQSKIDVIV